MCALSALVIDPDTLSVDFIVVFAVAAFTWPPHIIKLIITLWPAAYDQMQTLPRLPNQLSCIPGWCQATTAAQWKFDELH